MGCEVGAERVGDIIVTSLKGVPTAAAIVEANHRILSLINETGIRAILYDGMEMVRPPLGAGDNIAVVQWKCNEDFANIPLRRAVVVNDPHFGYLARLAFGESGEFKVFYNDREAALQWLKGT